MDSDGGAHRLWCVAALTLLCTRIVAAEPTPTDRETARSLMKEGDGYLNQQDAEQALRAYQAAHALMNVPSTGVAVARALTALGRLVEARDVALQVVRSPMRTAEPAVWARAREEAALAARALEARIAGVIVHAPPGSRVAIDGVTLAESAVGLVRKVDPGAHVIVVSAPGLAEVTLEVTLAEGETREVSPELEPITEPSPPARRPTRQPSVTMDPPPARPAQSSDSTTGRVLLVGGASAAALGLVVGSVSGAMAMSRTAELQRSCPTAGCPASRQDDYDAAHRWATVSNAAFAVGVVGLAVGTYGYFVSSSSPTRAPVNAGVSVEPAAGLEFAGVRGRF